MKSKASKDIAIIGMAGRFPGARNIEELYQNLRTGRDSIGVISKKRIKETALPLEEKYLISGYLEDIDKFDYKLFNISPGEARLISPHQRQLLEVAYECLENAGCNLDDMNGGNIATFIAASSSDYYKHNNTDYSIYDGGTNSFWASRIARFFNFRGLSSIVETNCSSGLVALNFAYNELFLGEADYAFVGGANIYTYPLKTYHEKLGIYSSTGKTGAFSDNASGMSRGEMVIGLLLKPLNKAIQDKNFIHAVVKSVAINNNANRSASPSTPDSIMQSKAILKAWRKAKINPCNLGYIEAHGSGTKLGDGLEVEGLNLAFSCYSELTNKCPISTIKSNIGHGSSMAGLAGMVRAVLSLKYKKIFSSINFDKPSSLIDFKRSFVYVNKECKTWKISSGEKRLAGVTALGLSGVNAHAVLEEFPILKKKKNKKNSKKYYLTFSAHSYDCLRDDILNFKNFLSNKKNLQIKDIAFTLNRCRKHYFYRYAVVTTSIKNLTNSLFLDGKNVSDKKERELVFIFSDYEKNENISGLKYLLSKYAIFEKNYKLCLNNRSRSENLLKFAFQFAFCKLLEEYNIKSTHNIGDELGLLVVKGLKNSHELKKSLNKLVRHKNTKHQNQVLRTKKMIEQNFSRKHDYFFVAMSQNNHLTNLICDVDNSLKPNIFLHKNTNDLFLQLVKFLYLNNYNISWSKFYKNNDCSRVELPNRSFEKNKCWVGKRHYKLRSINEKKICSNYENKEISSDSKTVLFKQILEIWRKELKLKKIYSDNNFFELGGDSLNASRVIIKINKKFNTKLDFEDIFDYPVFSSFYKLFYSRISKILKENDILDEIIDIWENVLSVGCVNKDSNFFELGGHSLLATQIINRIKTVYSIKLNFNDIFKSPTPLSIAKIIKCKMKSINQKNNDIRIQPVRLREYYQLSCTQKRMFVLYKIEPNLPFYNISTVKEITGRLNIKALREAFNILIERHESFRTNFIEKNNEPVQIIKPIDSNAKIKNIKKILKVYSSANNKRRHTANVNCQVKIHKIIKKYTQKPFRLETDSLIRIAIINISKNKSILIIVVHHIISDWWSHRLFYEELANTYNALLKNKKPNLSKLTIQYKDYAEWEKSNKNQKRLKSQKKYWLKELSGELPVLNLPTDKLRPVIQTYNGNTMNVVIDKKVIKELKKISEQKNTTLFTLFFTIFSVFLHRITGQNDLIVGTLIANRGSDEIENVVGCFTNNLSIRMNLPNKIRFTELLKNVKEKIISATDNGDYPFEDLIENLNLDRDMSRSPIFNVMCQVDEKAEKKINFDNLNIKSKYEIRATSQFDLKIRARKMLDGEFKLSIEYNTDLFFKETIEKFLQILEILIKDVIKNPSKKISELEILTKKEKNKLIKNFNNTKKDYFYNKTINQSFKEQAEKTPNNIAVEFMNNTITYRKMDEKLNQLASVLKREGIKKGDIIPIISDGSFLLPVAILAVLKCGAVYTPMESDIPLGRAKKIMKNCKARFVLTEKKNIKKIQSISRAKIINFESSVNFKEHIFKVKDVSKSHDRACIIYTSGSAGEPKGVVLSHRQIMCQVKMRVAMYKINNKDVISQNRPFGFVASIWLFFAPLIVGARLVIYHRKGRQDMINFFKKIIKNKITILTIPTTVLYLFDDEEGRLEFKNTCNLSNLRILTFGGEKFSKKFINIFHKIKCKKIEYYNTYGQSECSDVTICHKIDYNHKKKTMPIGKPVDNINVYILDNNRKLLPINFKGEIYISGDSLSVGYLNKDKETEKVFLPHPFVKGKKIYKTGDLGKILHSGEIEYLGRIDTQIRIRGARVEVGEIENAINTFLDINNSLVTVLKKSENKEISLITYYTTKTGTDIKIQKLKEHLKQTLPEYMIPTYFVHLKELPLNQNGKLDRLNIPKLSEENLDKNKYQKPQTKIEVKIAQIWQEELDVKKIGLNDNFFNLGGHSLKAIHVLSIINKEFKANLSLRDLFKYSSLCELSQKVENMILSKTLL